MRRYFLQIGFFLIVVCATAQIHPDSNWPVDIDILYQKGDSLYNKQKHQLAKSHFKQLVNVLEARTHEDASLINQQNYLYLRTRSAQCDYYLLQRDSALQESLLIADKIKELFDDDNIIAGANYNLLGLLTKDVKKSKDYYEKALAIRLKYLSPDHKDVAWTYDNLSHCHRKLGDFEKAKSLTLKAINIRENLVPQDSTVLVASYINSFTIFYNAGDFNKARELIFKADTLAHKCLPTGHRYFTLLYSYLSANYSFYKDIKKSLHYDLKALRLKKELRGVPYHNSYLNNYLNLSKKFHELSRINEARLYLDTAIIIQGQDEMIPSVMTLIYIKKSNLCSDNNERIELLHKALEYVKLNDLPDHKNEGIIYNNLSIFHKQQGDLAVALNYLAQAKNLYEKHLPETKYLLQLNYFSIATINQLMGSFQEAKTHMLKSLAIGKEFHGENKFPIVNNLRALGTIYTDLKEYDKAKEYFRETLRIEREVLGDTSIQLATTYLAFGDHYYEKGQYNLSIEQYNKCIGIHEIINHDLATELPKAYAKKARSYYKLGDHENNIKCIVKSLELIGFESSNGLYGRGSISDQNLFLACDILSSYIEYYHETPHLASFKNDVKLLITLFDQVKGSYFFESSGEQFQENNRSFFDNAIQKTYEISDTNETFDRLELLHFLIEKSKANNINKGFERVNFYSKHGIPDSILRKEKTILYEYEKSYQNIKDGMLQNIDDEAIKNLRSKLVFWQNEKEEFIERVKMNYPEYYNLRYTFQISDLDQVRKYCSQKNLIFLNYYWTDSLVTVMENHCGVVTVRQLNAKTIKQDITALLEILKERKDWQNEITYQAILERFKKNSHSLFKQLINSDLFETEDSHLVIAPDGHLSLIPFDLLLTKPNPEKNSYRQLSYLIRDYVISNIASATQLVSKNNRHETQKNYIGFSPDYGSDMVSFDQHKFQRNEFGPLTENINEVASVTALFDGAHFFGLASSEKNFKQSATKAGIIHLAMHTFIDNQNPINSYLKFSQDTTASEDGRLHAFEIPTMSLQNDLVVLSACETNKGTLQKGDGIMGLAKAFQLAGSSNLVLSHWVVDDESASNLIHNFFEKVQSKVNFSVSLRNAKLEYLESCPEIKTNPAYWATFSYFGDPEAAIVDDGLFDNYWLLLIAAVIVLSLFVLKKSNSRFT